MLLRVLHAVDERSVTYLAHRRISLQPDGRMNDAEGRSNAICSTQNLRVLAVGLVTSPVQLLKAFAH